MATRKMSVTVDEELVDAVQGRVGHRGVSAFVSRAIRHELERDELRDLLAELEDVLGPPAPELIGEAAAAFDQLEQVAKPGSLRPTA